MTITTISNTDKFAESRDMLDCISEAYAEYYSGGYEKLYEDLIDVCHYQTMGKDFGFSHDDEDDIIDLVDEEYVSAITKSVCNFFPKLIMEEWTLDRSEIKDRLLSLVLEEMGITDSDNEDETTQEN